MNSKSESFRMTIDIPKSMHKRIKALAALGGMSLKDFVISGLEKQICDSPITNTETLQTIENIEQRKGLVKVESVDDLFKKLGS